MPTMMTTFGLHKLTADEKRRLVRELELELEPDVATTGALSEAQREELRRRAASADANPESGKPWEQVYSATLARLGQ